MITIKIKRNLFKSKASSLNMTRQRGLALPLTLILLLVMTLIGVATLRSTTMEENMTANSRLRQVAFNAAESALREAEMVAGNLSLDSIRGEFIGKDTTSGLPKKRPKDGEANSGDTCTNGFCTPAQFTQLVGGALPPEFERWEDPDLDVWETDNRHFEYSDFATSNLGLNGVIEAPKYIIEFLGNYDYKEPNVALASNPKVRPKYAGAYRGNCRSSENNALEFPNNQWPYCASDPAVFRVTVRATAGPPARQAVVTLQSTLRIP